MGKDAEEDLKFLYKLWLFELDYLRLFYEKTLKTDSGKKVLAATYDEFEQKYGCQPLDCYLRATNE